MAVLPPIRRLVLQDYVSQSSWIGPLLQNINNFNDALYNALNKALTLKDNSTGAIIPVTLINTPTSDVPVTVAWTKTQTPVAVIIGNIQQRDSSKNGTLVQSGKVLSSAVSLEWQYVTSGQGNKISITNLVGITPTSQLEVDLQLVVFTG